MFNDLGPTEPLFVPGIKKPADEPAPNWESEKFLAIAGECFAIYLILFGAGTTLDHFPL